MLKIATYNIRGALGIDGMRAAWRIAATAISFEADIVCFQEVYQWIPFLFSLDQPRALGRMMEQRFHYMRCIDYLVGGYGIGIATNNRVTNVYRHKLPSRKEPRGALEIVLAAKDGFPVTHVFCSHWGLHPEERLEQANALAVLINRSPEPAIVCGDLNEPPEGTAIRRLSDLTGLLDAGSNSNDPTFPSTNPNARIDYILHSPVFHMENYRLSYTHASDHLPVTATFSLKKREERRDGREEYG